MDTAFTPNQISQAFTSPEGIPMITTTPNNFGYQIPSSMGQVSPQQVATMDHWKHFCEKYSPKKSLLWLLVSLLIGGILVAIIIVAYNNARKRQGFLCSVDHDCSAACKNAPKDSICQAKCINGKCKAVITGCKPGYQWSQKERKCVKPVATSENDGYAMQSEYEDEREQHISSHCKAGYKWSDREHRCLPINRTEEIAYTGEEYIKPMYSQSIPSTITYPSGEKQLNSDNSYRQEIWTTPYSNQKLKGSPWETKTNNGGDDSNPWTSRYRKASSDSM